MSLDTSLKVGADLTKHRNVLTRAERIERLKTQGRFDPESDHATGLPKVGNRKVIPAGKVKKKATTEGDEKDKKKKK